MHAKLPLCEPCAHRAELWLAVRFDHVAACRPLWRVTTMLNPMQNSAKLNYVRVTPESSRRTGVEFPPPGPAQVLRQKSLNLVGISSNRFKKAQRALSVRPIEKLDHGQEPKDASGDSGS